MIIPEMVFLRGNDQPFTEHANIDEFINYYSRGIDYISSYEGNYQDKGLSVNVSLFGSFTNTGSESFNYFYHGSSFTPPKMKEFFNLLTNAMGLNANFDEYYAIYKKFAENIKNNFGSMYQIFIDPELVNNLVYLSRSDSEFKVNESSKPKDLLQVMTKDPNAFHAMVTSERNYFAILEARFYLDPNYIRDINKVNIKTYHNKDINPYDMVNYEAEINKLVYKDIAHHIHSKVKSEDNVIHDSTNNLHILHQYAYAGSTGQDFAPNTKSLSDQLIYYVSTGNKQGIESVLYRDKNLVEKFLFQYFRDNTKNPADIVKYFLETQDMPILDLLFDHDISFDSLFEEHTMFTMGRLQQFYKLDDIERKINNKERLKKIEIAIYIYYSSLDLDESIKIKKLFDNSYSLDDKTMFELLKGAAMRGHYKSAEILLQNIKDKNSYPIDSVLTDDLSTIKWLIDHNYIPNISNIPNANDILYQFVEQNKFDYIDKIFENKIPEKQLFLRNAFETFTRKIKQAKFRENERNIQLNIVDKLIDLGFVTNDKDIIYFICNHYASHNLYNEIEKLLESQMLSSQKQFMILALNLIENNKQDLLQRLFDKKFVNLNLDNLTTLLHTAVLKKSNDIADIIFQHTSYDQEIFMHLDEHQVGVISYLGNKGLVFNKDTKFNKTNIISILIDRQELDLVAKILNNDSYLKDDQMLTNIMNKVILEGKLDVVMTLVDLGLTIKFKKTLPEYRIVNLLEYFITNNQWKHFDQVLVDNPEIKDSSIISSKIFTNIIKNKKFDRIEYLLNQGFQPDNSVVATEMNNLINENKLQEFFKTFNNSKNNYKNYDALVDISFNTLIDEKNYSTMSTLIKEGMILKITDKNNRNIADFLLYLAKDNDWQSIQNIIDNNPNIKLNDQVSENIFDELAVQKEFDIIVKFHKYGIIFNDKVPTYNIIEAFEYLINNKQWDNLKLIIDKNPTDSVHTALDDICSYLDQNDKIDELQKLFDMELIIKADKLNIFAQNLALLNETEKLNKLLDKGLKITDELFEILAEESQFRLLTRIFNQDINKYMNLISQNIMYNNAQIFNVKIIKELLSKQNDLTLNDHAMAIFHFLYKNEEHDLVEKLILNNSLPNKNFFLKEFIQEFDMNDIKNSKRLIKFAVTNQLNDQNSQWIDTNLLLKLFDLKEYELLDKIIIKNNNSYTLLFDKLSSKNDSESMVWLIRNNNYPDLNDYYHGQTIIKNLLNYNLEDIFDDLLEHYKTQPSKNDPYTIYSQLMNSKNWQKLEYVFNKFNISESEIEKYFKNNIFTSTHYIEFHQYRFDKKWNLFKENKDVNLLADILEHNVYNNDSITDIQNKMKELYNIDEYKSVFDKHNKKLVIENVDEFDTWVKGNEQNLTYLNLKKLKGTETLNMSLFGKLEKFTMSYCSFDKLEEINNCKNIKELKVIHSQLHELDINELTELKLLNCLGNSSLKKISVKNISDIESKKLNLNNDYIEILTLSKIKFNNLFDMHFKAYKLLTNVELESISNLYSINFNNVPKLQNVTLKGKFEHLEEIRFDEDKKYESFQQKTTVKVFGLKDFIANNPQVVIKGKYQDGDDQDI